VRASINVASMFGNAIMAVLADGTRFALVDDKGALSDFAKPDAVLKSLGFPTYTTIATLYDFEGEVGAELDTPFGKLRGLHVTKATPAVVIDGCALASVLIGTWEGTVSTRLAQPIGGGPLTKYFDESRTAPIHMTVSAATDYGKLADWNGRVSKLDNFKLNVVIDNAVSDFKDGDATYPSLKALGDAAPFQDSTDGPLTLVRLGAMHGIGADGHWVLDYPAGSKNLTTNGMTQEAAGMFAAGASWLTQRDAAADLGEIVIRPHLPYSRNGHVVRLRPLKVGARVGVCGK
jgi:hypothetical protein